MKITRTLPIHLLLAVVFLCLPAEAAQTPQIATQAWFAIPGPLPQFLRLAAISQKARPAEILPLMARNVINYGYRYQDKGTTAPTEFLILLKGYLSQARELRSLAGAEGVIRIDKCSDASPLLKVLGYGHKESCGPAMSLDIVDPKRAFLTSDAGFPLADLEEALRTGRTFSWSSLSVDLPILFTADAWAAPGKDLVDTLLDEPEVARLYWSMAQLDGNTRNTLRMSPGLTRLRPLAPAMYFYGSQILIRAGRVVVPGGSAADSAWKRLVGVGPDTPAQFVTNLLGKDGGWLAVYFDILARMPHSLQAFFAESGRLERCYEALHNKEVTINPTRAFFRPSPELLLLTSRLQLDAGGRPQVPGGLEVWKEFFRKHPQTRLERQVARQARRWNRPDQMIEGLFAFASSPSRDNPIQVYLAIQELDRRRQPAERLSAKTVRLLADRFSRLGSQYPLFAEHSTLNGESIARYISAIEGIDAIRDDSVSANAMGIFEATVGLWRILARQSEIPGANLNESFQRVIQPFAGVKSSEQLFDAARASLAELARSASGKAWLTQSELLALLAGPEQATSSGRQIRQELTDRLRGVLAAQRLVSLDLLFELADGLSEMARGRTEIAAALIDRAKTLGDFEMPRPLFTARERSQWALGYNENSHAALQSKIDLPKLVKQNSDTPQELAKLRGRLTPFLRDTLVGVNYAYYEPPGAQLLHNNSVLVRSHDFSGSTPRNGSRSWRTPRPSGRGRTAGLGTYLEGSLADLPYALAEVEQDFIVPENVQALIWGDLVPNILVSAVLPRWWNVTPLELRGAALYQHYGEDLIAAAATGAELRVKVLDILTDRLYPQWLEYVEGSLKAGQSSEALSYLMPTDLFFLAAEFVRHYPDDAESGSSSGQALRQLIQQYPAELDRERIARDFGAPHPILAHSYAPELLGLKPFPSVLGFSSRLLSETWESNNLFWARLAEEKGLEPVILHKLVPLLTHRMVEKLFGTNLDDWPAILRALQETGAEFRAGKLDAALKNETAP